MTDQQTKVVALREAGTPVSSIARELGVTRQRVYQIQAEAASDVPLNPVYAGLSTRALRCCERFGLGNKAQILEAVKSGAFHPGKTPTLGRACYREIVAWLGLQESSRSDLGVSGQV